MTAPTAVDSTVDDARWSAHRRAAETVCRHATSAAEARVLLDMLGLVEDGHLVPDVAVLGRHGWDGHDVVLAERQHAVTSTAPPALRELPPVATPQTPTRKAPPARTAVGTAPGPHAGPVTGRRASGAAPQVSPSRSHRRNGGGPGASDAVAAPPATRSPRANAARCGTVSGAKLHRRRGEPVCQPCLDADRAYQAQRRRRAGRPQRTPSACGTSRGYYRHRSAGEDACRPCKDAVNAYMKQRAEARQAARGDT